MRKSEPKLVARISARALAQRNGGTLGQLSPNWFRNLAKKGIGALLLDEVFAGPGLDESGGERVVAFQPAREIGGEDGLADFREKAHLAGLLTLGVFLGNHVEKSSPLPSFAPEWLMGGGSLEIAEEGGVIRLDLGEEYPRFFYEGKDPNFPPVAGTLQINASHPGVRNYLATVFGRLATFLDGVYCSQAMLLLGQSLEKTWGEKIYRPVPGAREKDSPWPLWLESAKDFNPNFLAMAEVYWGLEWSLMQDGFGHCLDQRMVERIEAWDLAGLGDHLSAPWEYLGKTQHPWPGRTPFAGVPFSPDELARFALYLFSPGLKLIRIDEGALCFPEAGEAGVIPGWEDVACLLQVAGALDANFSFHLIERPEIPGDKGSGALVLGWFPQQKRQVLDKSGEVILIANGHARCLAGFISWDRLGKEFQPKGYQMVLAGNQAPTTTVCEVEREGLRYNLPGNACLLVQLG